MNHTAPSPRTIRLLATTLICCVAGGSAIAATNRVAGGINLNYGPPSQTLDRGFFVQESSSSVADSAYHVAGNTIYTQVGRVDARAGFGSVGISASTSYQMNQQRYVHNGNYEKNQAFGTATATFTDVLVTGPGSGNISTRIRMHLSGVLNSSSVPSLEPEGSTAGASVSFGIYVNNNLVGWGNRTRSSINGGAPETTAAGLFAGFGGSGVVTTDFFSVPRNTPVTVKLEISTSLNSRLQGNQAGASSASCDYYNSLSFATDQPVFDLPAGHTANSTDGLIVNNSYQPNTNAPVLNIQSGPNIVLSWLATNQTTQLQYSTNILGPWSAPTTPPVLTNSQFVLPWTNKINSAFFRLRAF